MSIDAIKVQAADEGIYTPQEIADIQNNAIQIYDAIGSEYISQRDFIISPTNERNYKSPTIADFIKVHDNFQVEKIKDFVESAEPTIKLIQSTKGFTEGKLDNITEGLSKIALDPIDLSTLDRLRDISVELKNIKHGD